MYRIDLQNNPCWVWPLTKFKAGYGRFFWRGKDQKAHRVFYEVFIGTIPNGAMLCHKCDNPPCVNPTHIFLGTAQDNLDDNVYWYKPGRPGGPFRKQCRTCTLEKQREKYNRKGKTTK